jgi:hypothetical protein
MMWRSSFILAGCCLLLQLNAQVAPPPPPPPAPGWTRAALPSQEERLFSLAKRNCTLDELLYPLSYYDSDDYIFFETADSVRAKRKIKRAYFEFTDKDGEPPPSMFYSYYDKSGRLEQTSAAHHEWRDSIVHKWKYDNLGRLKTYVTLTYDLETAKPRVYGDSVAIKYNTLGQATEITRYGVKGAGAGRTSSFTSKETYAYNTAGGISSKLIDGFKYTYRYNTQQKITRVECKASYDGEMYTIDSFAWKSGSFTDTLEHWAVSGYDHLRLLMDVQVFNTLTGQELSYMLYPEEKFNFIRDLRGPMQTSYAYDVARRVVSKTIRTTDGVLLYEQAYTYAQDGLALSMHSLSQYDPRREDDEYNDEEYDEEEEEDEQEYDHRTDAALPPAARNFNGNLFFGTQLSYLVTTPGQMPEAIEIKNTLVGVKGDFRELLAHGATAGKLRIVCEYYP